MPYQLVLAINAVPCVLSGIVWASQRRDPALLFARKGVIFLFGLITNTICSIALLAFVVWLFFGGGRPFGGAVEDKVILSMIAMGLLSAIAAVFGKGLSRSMLVANGVLVALQWWLLAGLGF